MKVEFRFDTQSSHPMIQVMVDGERYAEGSQISPRVFVNLLLRAGVEVEMVDWDFRRNCRFEPNGWLMKSLKDASDRVALWPAWKRRLSRVLTGDQE